MSRDASLGPLDWADGSYTFKLDWERLILLQEATDAGPLFLLDRLGGKHVRLQDISNTIRLGLIGGGTKPADALKLVRAYVESRPMIENTQIAYAILAAGVMGAPDEAPGEPAGAAATGESSMTSPTENTASP